MNLLILLAFFEITTSYGYTFINSDCGKSSLEISMYVEYRLQSKGPPTSTECVENTASDIIELSSQSFSCSNSNEFQLSLDTLYYDGGNGTFASRIFDFTSAYENDTVNIYIKNGDFTGVCYLTNTQGACTWCFGEAECSSSICTYGVTVFVQIPFWLTTSGKVTIASVVIIFVFGVLAITCAIFVIRRRIKTKILPKKKIHQEESQDSVIELQPHSLQYLVPQSAERTEDLQYNIVPQIEGSKEYTLLPTPKEGDPQYNLIPSQTEELPKEYAILPEVIRVVSKWTEKEVLEWLETQNLSNDLKPIFLEHKIDGEVLVTATPEEWVSLIPTFGVRKKLMNALQIVH